MHPLPFALLLQASGGTAALMPLLFQIAAFVAIFYFILVRPQQQQKRRHEETLRNIKRGDRVVTAGGIIGDVVHIKDSIVDGTAQRTMEDEVTIRSGESRLVVERGRIARIVTAQGTSTSA